MYWNQVNSSTQTIPFPFTLTCTQSKGVQSHVSIPHTKLIHSHNMYIKSFALDIITLVVEQMLMVLK